MKNIFILTALTVLFSTSCTKNTDVKVTYEATGAVSEYFLYYRDAGGILQNVDVKPESEQDVWNVSFTGERGDIVYLSGKYNDPNSALKLMIKVDGKVYKQASNEGDTLKYLTVSGTIPYKQ